MQYSNFGQQCWTAMHIFRETVTKPLLCVALILYLQWHCLAKLQYEVLIGPFFGKINYNLKWDICKKEKS